MSDKAIKGIAMFDTALAKASNFRNLYQNVADVMMPNENNITTQRTPGEEKMRAIADTTAIMAVNESADGLSTNIFPPGQDFFSLLAVPRALNDIESVKRYLSRITTITHEKIFESNFMSQVNESLRSLIGFGTSNLFSEWDKNLGLNFRDYDVGRYVILENSKGRVDIVLMKFNLTARQAVQEYGDKVGPTIATASENEETWGKEFEFIWIVHPRTDRNKRLSDVSNMPFEELIIDIADKVVVREEGFPEFPFAVARWSKSSNEVWGRGQGVFALWEVQDLQKIKRDFIECGNKHNNPPLEVLENFEGEVNVSPGATNFVLERGTIRAIEQGARGNFPVSKDVLEFQIEVVKKALLNDVFIQLRDLKGDRRNELEIRERLAEGLRRIGRPFGQITQEKLIPTVTRVVNLLFRNGQFPRDIPPEIQGQGFKIEFLGRLAMELKGQQSRGVRQWIVAGAELEGSFPGISDNIRIDSGYRRIGETMGVNIEDIATEEEVAQKREARALAQEQARQMELLQTAGQAYPGATKAPEAGSPAEQLLGAG